MRYQKHLIAGLVAAFVGAAVLMVTHVAEAASELSVVGVYCIVTSDDTAASDITDTPESDTSNDPEPAQAEEPISAFVQIGSTLVSVPEQPTIESGAEVLMTLRAPAEYTLEQAVSALASRPAGSSATSAPVTILSIGTSPTNRAANAGAFGKRTLTVLPVYWGDSPDGATVASLTTMTEKVRDYWREQSSNRIDIADITVKDWKKIDTPDGCANTAIYNDAVAANGLPGVSANHHYLIYFPKTASCHWAGLGSVSGSIMWDNGMWSPSKYPEEAMAHEFGHNLGLSHANQAVCTENGKRVPMIPTSSTTGCKVKEYQDSTDVMGKLRTKPSGNLNVASAYHLKLATVVSAVPGTALKATLSPISEYGKVRGLRIPLSDGTELFLELRPAAGRDVRQRSWAGVQVRRRVASKTNKRRTTELLDMQPDKAKPFTKPNMPVGASYRVPNENFIITVDSVSDSSAEISVEPATATA